MGETTDEVKPAYYSSGSRVELPSENLASANVGSTNVGSTNVASTNVASTNVTLSKGDESGEGSAEAAQIRSGIEQTRSNLSSTIDALQEKLDPTRIAEQVKEQIREKATEAYEVARDAVKEATIGKAGKIVSSMTETVSDVSGRAGSAVMESSSSMVQYVRDNPIPFAMLGIGAGMLIWNRSKSQGPSYRSGQSMAPLYVGSSTESVGTSQQSLTDRAKGAVSGVAESARGAAGSVAETARAAAERASTAVTSAASTVRDAAGNAVDTTRQQFTYVSDQARQGATATTETFKTTLQENPMAVGVAALALGALVGLTMPTTRIESEYMGDARDRLMGQAKSVAQDAAQKVQRVTEEAGRTFKDAAEKEGLMTS